MVKSVFKLLAIVLLTTGIVLFILSKSGIAYYNFSFLEKGKVLLGMDEVSQLSALDYPKLGDNLALAYKMLGDASFESEGKSDFYLLDDREKIYVEHGHNDKVIDSFKFYLSGNIKQIRLLGEKMLPDSYLQFGEESYTKEKRNEIGRYTTTYFINEYQYESSVTGERATITISHDTNDLFVEEDVSPIVYTLRIEATGKNPIVEINSSKKQAVQDNKEDMVETEVERSIEQSEVTFQELKTAVMYEGNLTKIENYLKNYNDKTDLSELLPMVSYLSTDRNKYGYNETAKLLLLYGADPNYTDSQGYTPLSHAVLQYNISLVKVLLESGADKNVIEPSGESLLSIVNASGNTELIQLFE